VGLIPTGVGNTRGTSRRKRLQRAHPHGCGEHSLNGQWLIGVAGSSPRVWGTHVTIPLANSGPGLIPTGVGNTPCCYRHVVTPWAHPHGCGEHGAVAGSMKPIVGSSPRVWGTPPTRTSQGSLPGLIPTGVGNTGHVRPVLGCRWAHPHGCGEHCPWKLPLGRPLGSSPRVWGTRFMPGYTPGRDGLIPTGVGNTLIDKQRYQDCIPSSFTFG